jgi:hypothetical protein
LKRRTLSVVIGLPARRGPLGPFVTGSLVVHLCATAALAILPALHRTPVAIGDAWVVGLAAPLPSPATPAGGEPAAQPAPETAPAPGVRLDLPKPHEKTKDLTKKEKKEKPDAKPEAPSPSSGPTPQVGPTLPGGSVAPPGSTGPGIGVAGGTGVFSTDVIDAQLAWYRATVVASLQSRWIRPVLDAVRNVKVDASSGVPSLDRSALRAVEDASPLPPLPVGWGQPPFAARFEFRWSPGNP